MEGGVVWLVNTGGLLLIGLIVWWFWLYRTKGVDLGAGGNTVVVADGIYQPARLNLPSGQPVTLEFLRRDASPCAETVLFPDLEISASLPVGKPRQVALPALAPGVYPFHCQMQMYRGELHVT